MRSAVLAKMRLIQNIYLRLCFLVSDPFLLEQLTKHKFSQMMKKYMLLSNRLEEEYLDKTRKFVREQKDNKRKGEMLTDNN